MPLARPGREYPQLRRLSRGSRRGAGNWRITHCRRGHLPDPAPADAGGNSNRSRPGWDCHDGRACRRQLASVSAQTRSETRRQNVAIWRHCWNCKSLFYKDLRTCPSRCGGLSLCEVKPYAESWTKSESGFGRPARAAGSFSTGIQPQRRRARDGLMEMSRPKAAMLLAVHVQACAILNRGVSIGKAFGMAVRPNRAGGAFVAIVNQQDPGSVIIDQLLAAD
jgi:hypothetical protein